MLVPTNESKEITKTNEEMWSKIKDLIRLITKNFDDYDEEFMKIKFNSADELPLNTTIRIHNTTIVVRAGFHENNKYSLQVSLQMNAYMNYK